MAMAWRQQEVEVPSRGPATVRGAAAGNMVWLGGVFATRTHPSIDYIESRPSKTGNR